MITSERVRELLNYDSETGILTWKKARRKIRVGAVAGCKMRNGYLSVRLDGKLYLAHRLVWLHQHGEWPKEHIDHINGEVADNRISNLREAIRSQNMANAKRKSNSQSGFKGVEASGSKWVAYIGGYRKTYIGIFDSPEEPHAAYFAAARKRYGEFARAG
jgi:hypothetical protein